MWNIRKAASCVITPTCVIKIINNSSYNWLLILRFLRLLLKSSSTEYLSLWQRRAVKTHVKTLAGIIWDSGAASIKDCHVLVELGMTKPNSKNHSEKGTQTNTCDREVPGRSRCDEEPFHQGWRWDQDEKNMSSKSLQVLNLVTF